MPSASLDGRALDLRRKKSAALLYYLGATARPLARASAASLLWPEFPPDHARTSLRGALLNLDTAAGRRLFTLGGGPLSFEPDIELQVDSSRFIELSARALAAGYKHGVLELEMAAALYRGDFLAGFYLSDAFEFEDWQLNKTDRFRARAVEVLALLADAYKKLGQDGSLATVADRIIEIAPLHEAGHRLIVEYLADRGESAAACEHFEAYAAMLERGRGARPEPSFMALYRSLKAGARGAMAEGRSSRPSALPNYLSSFIGRGAELEAVRSALAKKRLVTIVGPGGIGKTRLAVEAARLAALNYSDGVAFADLSAADAAGVLPPIAACLRVQLQPNESDTALAARLAGRSALLMLDNCEAVAERCASAALAILTAAPGITIIATSLEPLGVDGERVIELGALALPAEGARAEALLEAPATALFVDRASDAAPGVDLSGSAEDIATLCRNLGGIPLALELAAARIRSMPIEALAAGFLDPLSLSSETPAAAPPRHRSLRALLDWTWQFLDPEEGSTIAALSVCRGSFSHEAVEALSSAPAAKLMCSLVSKSVVSAVRDCPIQPRWRMLEPIRLYAEERLRASSLEAGARAAHASHYLERAERFGLELSCIRNGFTLDRVQDDWPNVTLAIRHALRLDSAIVNAEERCLSALIGLRRFLLIRDKGAELAALLALFDTARLLSPAGMAAFQELKSLCSWFDEDLESMKACSDEASRLWLDAGDEGASRRAELINLGFGILLKEEIPWALSRLRESASWFAAQGNDWLRCEALFKICGRVFILGSLRWKLILSTYDELRALIDKMDDLEGRASCAWLGLWVARWRGDSLAVGNSLAELRHCDDALGVPYGYKEFQDDPYGAYAEESAANNARLGHPGSAIESLIDAVDAFLARGDYDSAFSTLDRAHALAEAQGLKQKASFVLYYKSLALFDQGKQREAFELMRVERARLETGTLHHRRVSCYLAHLSIGLEDEDESRELHRQAVAYLRDAPDADEDERCEMYLRYFEAGMKPAAAASYVRSSLSREYDQLSSFELMCLGAISVRALSAVGERAGAYEAALVMQNGIRWRLTAYHAVERYLARWLLERLLRELRPEERSELDALRMADPRRDGISAYLKDGRSRLLRVLGQAFWPGSAASQQQGQDGHDGDEGAVRGQP